MTLSLGTIQKMAHVFSEEHFVVYTAVRDMVHTGVPEWVAMAVRWVKSGRPDLNRGPSAPKSIELATCLICLQ
jgi:hypothetical protein